MPFSSASVSVESRASPHWMRAKIGAWKLQFPMYLICFAICIQSRTPSQTMCARTHTPNIRPAGLRVNAFPMLIEISQRSANRRRKWTFEAIVWHGFYRWSGGKSQARPKIERIVEMIWERNLQKIGNGARLDCDWSHSASMERKKVHFQSDFLNFGLFELLTLATIFPAPASPPFFSHKAK